MHRTLLALFTCLTVSLPLLAQDAGGSLLLQPERILLNLPPVSGLPTLGLQVDDNVLSFVAPQVLIYKKTGQAEFVSAVWKDASGQLIHQRDVFIVQPDYGVIVDYLYDEGQHKITRSWTSEPGGDNLIIRNLDNGSGPASLPIAITSTVTTPSRFATVFATRTGTAMPKIEAVKPSNPMIVKFNVTFPDGRVDQVALAWEARPLHLVGASFNGWAACLRKGPGGNSSIEINP